jgi:hypothetical protein
MAFTYADKHHQFYAYPSTSFDFTWPHLTHADNGFGGSVDFTYTEKLYNFGQALYWSRQAVTEERRTPGGSQPQMFTTYSYGNGPTSDGRADQFGQSHGFDSDYLGFRTVNEIDPSGNKVIHTRDVTADTAWEFDPVKTGRELTARVEDSGSGLWHETATTWATRPVANAYTCAPGLCHRVNFLYPSQTVTTLRDGTQLTTKQYFDDRTDSSICATPCYGLLTKIEHLGVSGTNDDVIAKTAYHQNTAAWIFPPKYAETIDPAGTLLRCTKHYYDGAKLTTSAPVRGLLTASSVAIAGTAAQCEGTSAFTSSTNSYMEYETFGSPAYSYGNVAKASVATSTAPENATGSGAFGWIHGSTAYGISAFDATHHLFPTTATNAMGHQIVTAFDFVVGKPTSVTVPHLASDLSARTQMRYDRFGRAVKSWDECDSETYRRCRLTAWGTVPNRTSVSQRPPPHVVRGPDVVVLGRVRAGDRVTRVLRRNGGRERSDGL